MSYQEINPSLIGALKANAYALWDLIRSNFADHQSRLNTLDSTFLYTPVGTIILYSAASVPTGYLACDGSLVSRGTYPDLFALIGETFGAGDGLTTFKLPDYRGRVGVGVGTGVGLTPRAMAATGGEETHALSTGEIPSHNHTVVDPGHFHNWSQAKIDGGIPGASPLWTVATPNTGNGAPVPTAGNTTGITIADAGSGTGHENMQPFVAVQFLVKF